MESKKKFLKKDNEKSHPLLSEYLAMASWGYQVRHFEESFRGLIPYFHTQPEGSFGVDYLWLTDGSDKDRRAEDIFRCTLQQNFLDSIRNDVKAIGSVGEGHHIQRQDYSDKESTESVFSLFYPDDDLVKQVRDVFIEEDFINGNNLSPQNIFYYKMPSYGSSDLEKTSKSKTWLKTISLAHEQFQKYTMNN